MNIPIKELKKWIAALDSGEYEQSQEQLQNDDGYCCLGVACKVFISEDHQTLNAAGQLAGALPSDQIHSPEWLKKIEIDFHNRTGEFLSSLNDEDNFTFTEIATLLELVYIHKILD